MLFPLLHLLISSLVISSKFGGDCTASAIENRFRRIKRDAKLINSSILKGIDPITLDIDGEGGETASMSTKGRSGQAKPSSCLPTQHIYFRRSSNSILLRHLPNSMVLLALLGLKNTWWGGSSLLCPI